MTMRPSSQTDFPYGYPGRVCYIEQIGAELTQLSYRDDIRQAVVRANGGESRILAVWPGQYRSDLFIVDNLPKLAEAVGITLHVSPAGSVGAGEDGTVTP